MEPGMNRGRGSGNLKNCLHHWTRLGGASLLLAAATACRGGQEEPVSDYSLYSPAVQALIDSTASPLVLIRRVAAVDQYWEEI